MFLRNVCLIPWKFTVSESHKSPDCFSSVLKRLDKLPPPYKSSTLHIPLRSKHWTRIGFLAKYYNIVGNIFFSWGDPAIQNIYSCTFSFKATLATYWKEQGYEAKKNKVLSVKQEECFSLSYFRRLEWTAKGLHIKKTQKVKLKKQRGKKKHNSRSVTGTVFNYHKLVMHTGAIL